MCLRTGKGGKYFAEKVYSTCNINRSCFGRLLTMIVLPYISLVLLLRRLPRPAAQSLPWNGIVEQSSGGRTSGVSGLEIKSRSYQSSGWRSYHQRC